MASRELQNTFEEAVGLCQDFISQTRTQKDNDNINVSGFEGEGSGNGNEGNRRGNPHARLSGGYKGNNIGKRKHQGGGGDIEDRHYSPAQYS
jgi:hypothetical protein